MNTLIHLWPGSPTTCDLAILETPCFPASFYFGPVNRSMDSWVPADNSTSRFHRTLSDAISAADRRGAITAAIRRAEVQRVAPDHLLVTQRLAALRTDAGLSEAIAYLPELASLVDHAEAVLKGAPFEASGYAGGGGP